MSEVDMDALAADLFPSMSGDANKPNVLPAEKPAPASKPAAPASKPASQPKDDSGKEALRSTKALAEMYDKTDSRERQIMDAAKEEWDAEQGPPPAPAATFDDVSEVVQDFGMEPNAQTEALGDWAGQHGLSREAVSQLMEIHDQHRAAEAEAFSDALYEYTVANVDNFTIQAAQEGLDRYADQDFKDLLFDSGLVNHPAVVQFLANIAKGKR